jgi:hypothetical protein
MVRSSLAVVLAASVSAAAAAPMFPLPAGAEKAGHAVIEEGVAEQDYFRYRAKYPSTEAVEYYAALLKGWTLCQPKDKGWIGYGDQSNGANRYMHTYSRFFLSPKGDEAVLVFLRYQSPGVAYRPAPEDDDQFVGVIRYRPKDMHEFLRMQSESCE